MLVERQSASQESDNANNSKSCNDLSFSPVWSTVQQALNIVTPYLPTWSNDPKQRYEWLRPHLPSEYILLWEILNGQYDFATPQNSRLLLLVTSIESHNLHNIWTVEFQDETGLTIRAWMEPRYVQQQLQQQHESSSTIRPGVIWMLSGVGMMVQTNEHEEKIERILLIGGQHVARVWTPEETEQNDSIVPDSDFLRWMEQKKAKSSLLPDMEDGDEEQDDASKENHSCENSVYAEASKDDRTSAPQVHHSEGRNDWISILRQHDEQDENFPSPQTESTFTNPSQTRDLLQHQSEQPLRSQIGQVDDSMNEVVPHAEDSRRTQIQHRESLANPYGSRSNHQSQKNPGTSSETISSCNKDNSEGAKRNQHNLSNHVDPSPNTVQNRTPPSTQGSKRKQKSLIQTNEAIKKNRSGVNDDSCSKMKSNLWDNIQDNSMLQLFDDDGDDNGDEDKHLHGENKGTEATIQNEEQQVDQEGPSNSSTTCQTSEGRLNTGATEESEQETHSPPKSQLQSSKEPSSLFAASNFEGIDSSLFDDDE